MSLLKQEIGGPQDTVSKKGGMYLAIRSGIPINHLRGACSSSNFMMRALYVVRS